ncbi:hypothetical protein LTR66_016710 [Elasticomyces elasticus]|nr:hypothetical protein LTR66_016710 [Elasticomyces elasticus]
MADNDTDTEKAKEVQVENPHDWPRSKKWMITILYALCTLTATFASSIFSSTIEVTSREFNVSETVMLLGVSLYVLGFALGPLLWGPLSEALGRKRPIFGAFLIFALLQIPVGLANSLAGILVCRLLAGCFGAAPIALVTAAYADFWDPSNRGIATALYSVAAYAGPTLGPVVGSFFTDEVSWRWTAWIILIMAAFFGIPAFLLIPESYVPVLKDRALHEAGMHAETRHITFGQFITKFLAKPAQMLMHEVMLDVMTLYISLVYGILYLTFYALPYSYQIRGWRSQIASLSFLSILVGVLTACVSVALYSLYYYQPRLKKRGKISPEDRLPLIMVGSILLPIGLFWFAWTSSPHITWVPQMISGFFVGAGIMLVFSNGIVYIVDIYLSTSASALAANTFVRSFVAAGLPLAAPTMYKNLGVAWATSVLGFLCVAAIPAPFLFYKYGPQLRARSTYAPNKPARKGREGSKTSDKS